MPRKTTTRASQLPPLESKPYEKPPEPKAPPEVEPLKRLPNEPDKELLKEQKLEEKALDRAAGEILVSQLFGADYIAANHAAELNAVMSEIARRKCESLRLYEPLPEQARFHDSRAKMRLLRGSNRGGKTLPAAVEVARAVTGQDPSGKYPKTEGRCFCVGKDLAHIGQVMWRKLGRSGAFKIIRDLQTGAWRAFRPWDPEDLEREAEAKRAPPLIPPRFIKEIGWENKREGIPNVVRLHNGWELSFFSSLGKPPQGSDIDLFWLDEEIVDGEWFPEMSARTLDRKGRGIWSATPQAGTDQLFELHERAEQLEGTEKPAVEEMVILLSANPHIQQEEKAELAANLSDDDRAVRIDGEFAVVTFKMYPSFSLAVHGVDDFEVPATWTRYMIVDPGYQVCACLFAAVPPPTEPPPLGGDHVYLFDELYLRDCDAVKFGDAVKWKTIGQSFEAFVIDPHMGIHTELGSGKTVARQYSDALKDRGVASATTGSGFVLGCDDVQAGILAVQGLLRIRPDGTPKLKVLRGRMPNFVYEIKRYHRKREHGVITDKPDQKRRNHLMDDLRYLALFNPRYVTPRKGKVAKPGARQAYDAKMARQKSKNGQSFVNLGPGSGASHAIR